MRSEAESASEERWSNQALVVYEPRAVAHWALGRKLPAVKGFVQSTFHRKVISASSRTSNGDQAGTGISAEGRAKRVMPDSRLSGADRSGFTSGVSSLLDPTHPNSSEIR